MLYTNTVKQETLGLLKQLMSLEILEAYFLNLLRPIIKADEIRMCSIEDIATMKIKAIEDRGYKRDFYDIYCLYKELSLESILDLTEQRYPETNKLHVLRCLVDFTDAEDQEDPNILDPVISWTELKEQIKNEVKRVS